MAVNLSVPQGALFGFLGPNGAGKTTAIRVLLGLLRPTSGTARVLGREAWSDSPQIKADVGYVPGDLRLYGWITGRRALAIVGGVRGRDLRRRGEELAEDFSLDLSVKVRKMSRGMRQKLGLIIALVHEPRLLILDEPTVTLDPLMQTKLHDHLRSLAARGHTVFFSSHTLSEVEALCDRVAIIREGRIVADEPLEALKARAGRRVTIHWRQLADVSELRPPPLLQIDRKEDSQWSGVLQGEVTELVDWLAGKPIDDLEIGHLDLEALFRIYYDSPDP